MSSLPRLNPAALIFCLILMVSCSTNQLKSGKHEGWRKDCRDGVCIYVTKLDDQSENFEVESTLAHPIKLTLKVEFTNSAHAPIVNKGEITKFINPKERVHILTLDSEKREDEVLFNYQYWWQ